jgi:phosphonate transport system permease protein
MAMYNYGGVTMVILAILVLVILGELVSHYVRKAVT